MIAMIVLPIFAPLNAYASYFGRGEGKGYFYGKSGSGKFNDDYNVIKKGIDKSDIKNADAFYKYLRDYYKNGSKQDKTGAAFIVNTMLGEDGPGYGKTFSESVWQDFKEKIENIFKYGEVKWTSYTICGKTSTYYQKSNNDDAFYELDKDDVIKALGKKKADSYCKPKVAQFKYDGSTLFRIAEDCSNPVGKLSSKGLPEPKKWTIKASTKVDIKRGGSVAGLTGSQALPGDEIKWTSTFTNDGPYKSTDKITTYLRAKGSSIGSWNGDKESDKNYASEGVFRIAKDYAINTNGDKQVSQNDTGLTLCEKARYSPTSWLDKGTGESNEKCINIKYNYNLSPSVSTDKVDEFVIPGGSISLAPYATNSIKEQPTISKSIQWQLTMVAYPVGSSQYNNYTNSTSYSPAANGPCPTEGNYFNNGITECVNIKSGNTIFDESGGYRSGTSLNTSYVIEDKYSIGQHICFAFSIKPNKSTPSSDDNRWYHSALKCFVVSKMPKVQILGNDLSVRGIIRTSTSDKMIANVQKRFGSWSEYGVLASSTISGIASGSAYADRPSLNQYGLKYPLEANDVCSYSRLSFANASTAEIGTACAAATVIGNYSNMLNVPDVESSFPSNETYVIANNAIITANKIDLPATGLYIGTGTGDGNITLDVSTLDKGKSIIIKTSGTVTIAGNQTYDNGVYTSISQLPQLVIIANKIIINSNVTRVDAWLVARGVKGIIETCNVKKLDDDKYKLAESEWYASDKCANQLIVNGPVIAKQLWLRRTFGSGIGAASGDPAEVFNLRADAYLWSMARASINGQAQTVYTVELPPRL